jgi:hypothetical protein
MPSDAAGCRGGRRESNGRPLAGPAVALVEHSGAGPSVQGQLPPGVTVTVPFVNDSPFVSSVMPARASLTMSLV